MRLLSATVPRFHRACRFIAATPAAIAAVTAGCTQSPPPTPAPRPAAVAHADDHDHGHGHGHGNATGKAGDHDHDHPRTLAAGVAEVKTLWGQVRDALGKGDRDKADEHVHEVGHLLEDVEGLLATLPEESSGIGKKALAEIFDCFDSLDAAFHGDEDDWKKIDLDSLAPRLEEAFKTLAAMGDPAAK